MTQNQSLNVLLVGDEAAAVYSLRLLADSPHQVSAVMATPSRDAAASSLWNTARRMGYETLPAKQVKSPGFARELAYRDIDVLLNVHSLFLVPGDVLEACRVGAFNLHPGPLPEYAGLDVPSWAIYNGETSHGVTLHRMVPRVDAGYIAYQTQFDLMADDTGLTAMAKSVRAGVPLVKQLLTDLYNDPASVPQIAQDFSRRRYFRREAPNDGFVDWNRSAADVVNHIRAADYSPFQSPWGHPGSELNGQSIGFVKATATDESTDAEPGTIGEISGDDVLVAAGDRWVRVKLIELQCETLRKPAGCLSTGERLMSPALSNPVSV
jgi:methionyl-tRNA formyltransferase